MNENILKLDTAIIGGGITGLYACLKLREMKGADHTIALFEMSDRFGGRIETVEMDGFLAEYGPMRFERYGQPLLMQLIRDLCLEICHFPPYTPATDRDSLFNLHEDESLPLQEKSNTQPFNMLELLSLGILRILQISGGDLNNPRDQRHWDWWAGLDNDFYRQMRTRMTSRGELLYKPGFWNLLSTVLSQKALNKIIHCGTFYHFIHENPSAAEWIIFWLRGLHPGDKLVGIKQGTEALITELVEKLSSLQPKPVPLYLNHCLTNIHENENNQILLELKTNKGKTVKVLARHAVLALHQSSLKKLAPFFPVPIGQFIDSVIPIPLFKCFFVTKSPWWNESTPPQTRASSVPTRELHYYYRGSGKDKRGMVMVYGDRPSINFWKTFAQNACHTKAELNQDTRLLDHYLKYLSFNPDTDDHTEKESQIKAITSFGIRDWGREPFGAGAHIWKPGVKIEEVIKELSGFSLSGSSSAPKNIHICGEAYSDYQGFIEGGLRTAQTVVNHIE